MIQLKILSGKMAGTTFVARHFPVRVGRQPGMDLQLEEPGLWDEHFQITRMDREGFFLENHPQASTTVNRAAVQQATALRNGDVVEIGSLKLQFWLDEPRQKTLVAGEAFVWTMVAAVTAVQFAVIYWLVR
ncbi:MAG: FHA domain-containing protein [Verrucomicrobiota bacterium]